MYFYDRLFTPGPTQIPTDVREVLAKPIFHHRGTDFKKLMASLQVRLKKLWGTKNPVIPMAASGTGAMEAAVVNLMGSQDLALVIDAGKFGHRWADLLKTYQIKYDVLAFEWGAKINLKKIKNQLAKKKYTAVFMQGTETSTGAKIPVAEIIGLVRSKKKPLFIVDGITAVGVWDIQMQKMGIDVLIGSSQKGFGLPPGLSLTGLSTRAINKVKKNQTQRFYFDYLKELAALKEGLTSWTPATSHLRALDLVLEKIFKEGCQHLFERHALIAQMIQKAGSAIKLQCVAQSPSPALTAFYTPQKVSTQDLILKLRKEFCITVAGGQGPLKNKIFRLGHLGFYDPLDILALWAAVEASLAKLGYNFTLGAGLKAMQKVLVATL